MSQAFDNMIFKSIDRVIGYNKATNALLFVIDEIQDGTLTNGEETVYGTGKLGGRISSLKKNKTVGFTCTNGFVNGGLLTTQFGTDVEVADGTTTTIIAPYFEYIEVGDTTTSITTTYEAVGTAGAEIGFIYKANPDGTQGQPYEQGSTASATEFAYVPATKTITLPTGEFNKGDIVIVGYDRECAGRKYTNRADVVSMNGKVVIEVTIGDACEENEYPAYFVIDNASFSGQFDLAFGGDQTVHGLTVEAIKNNCSTKKEFYSFIIPDLS